MTTREQLQVNEFIEAIAEIIWKSCLSKAPLLHPDAVRCAYIRFAVEHYGGNKSVAARALGLDRRSLQRMLIKNPDRRKGEPQPCRKNCHKCKVQP